MGTDKIEIAFFETKAPPPKHLPKIPKLVEEFTKDHPEIKEWGLVGLCWGGKVATLASTAGTPFKAAAQCHPAMVDPEDAKNVTIPMALLASKDEDAEAVKGYIANLSVPKYTDRFDDQIHGWMGARSDLKDPKVLKEYERGYTTLLTWFGEQL
jgi:dienelactone hydrolase